MHSNALTKLNVVNKIQLNREYINTQPLLLSGNIGKMLQIIQQMLQIDTGKCNEILLKHEITGKF